MNDFDLVAFSLYEPGTGRIVSNVTCPFIDVEANTPTGLLRVAGTFEPSTHYVENGEAVPRDPFEILGSYSGAAGQDIRLTGIPTGTEITSEGQTITMVSSGILDLNFDLPGSYLVEFRHPAFVDLDITVTVTP